MNNIAPLSIVSWNYKLSSFHTGYKTSM